MSLRISFFPKYSATCLLIISAATFVAHSAAAQSIDLGDFAAPATLTYQNSFNGQQGQFTDWYAFSVDNTSFNGMTASISFAQVFGIQFTSELYRGNLTGSQVNLGTLIATGNTSNTTFGNAVQSTSVIQPAYLSSGDYLIKISGAVSGTLGGSYAGIANMAPIPLPASLPFMAIGLGLLGFPTRLRKRI